MAGCRGGSECSPACIRRNLWGEPTAHRAAGCHCAARVFLVRNLVGSGMHVRAMRGAVCCGVDGDASLTATSGRAGMRMLQDAGTGVRNKAAARPRRRGQHARRERHPPVTGRRCRTAWASRTSLERVRTLYSPLSPSSSTTGARLAAIAGAAGVHRPGEAGAQEVEWIRHSHGSRAGAGAGEQVHPDGRPCGADVRLARLLQGGHEGRAVVLVRRVVQGCVWHDPHDACPIAPAWSAGHIARSRLLEAE